MGRNIKGCGKIERHYIEHKFEKLEAFKKREGMNDPKAMREWIEKVRKEYEALPKMIDTTLAR
jgi:hypothetical protein